MRAKTIPVAILIVSVLCSLSLAAWTEPVPVTEVNTEYQEWSPFLSFDGLSLYFARVRTNISFYGRIYEAKRQAPYGPFTSVSEVLSSSNQHVVAPWVSPDNLRMYYHAEIPSQYEWLLKVSERASVNDPWPQGTDISELNQLGMFLHTPKLTSDELIIFFGSPDIPGEGGYDIWMATRPDRNSPFDEVANLTELNTSDNEGCPSISPDGLTLLFHSDRNGSYQLFRATRQSLSEPFSNIEHLSALDTPDGLSVHPSLSSDGSALYFMRQLGDDRSTRDIYVSYEPYLVAVTNIENAIAEKLETLEKINAAIDMELMAYEALAELLESEDYGDLKEKDITKAMQQIESSIQQEDLSIKTLEKSIEKLEDALASLGWEPPPPPPEPDPSLVAYWKFDEGEGDIAYDSAGTNHGTIYGAAWTTGQLGSALDFDGVDDHVEVPDDDSLTPGSQITISFWVYNRGVNQAGIYKYAGCPGEPASPGNSRAYFMCVRDDTAMAQLCIYSTVYDHDKIVSNNAVPINEWHHITGTFNQGNAAIYINGQLDNSDVISVSSIMNDVQPLMIGGFWQYCDEDTFYSTNGIIDEVSIWNRALSAEEIQQLYNYGSAGLSSQAVDHRNKAAKKNNSY